MKKILFCLPLLLLALQSCEIEDEYMYDKGLYTIDWDAAADSSSVTLIDRFWNTEENYFNYGNDGSIKDFHYWPQAHAMDVMIDAYNRTGDSKYSDLFDKWYVGIKAKNGGSYWNNFYDDMEWIALTMIRLYEVTDENKYLETSQEMWNEIKTGWNDYAGGGIAWTHDRLWSKNACSNGPAALIAARLYRINGNQEDLDWAVNIYKWERENLFNPATGAIYDNVNGETGELSTLSLSYNQSTFLGAAYELYKITGEESYLKDARKAANFGISNSSMIDTGNNLLRDEGDGDGGLFKGIFMRYYVQLIMEPNLDPIYKKKFITFFNNNAEILWRKGINKLDLLYNTNWAMNNSGNNHLTTQTSGCTLIEAKALFEKSLK